MASGASPWVRVPTGRTPESATHRTTLSSDVGDDPIPGRAEPVGAPDTASVSWQDLAVADAGGTEGAGDDIGFGSERAIRVFVSSTFRDIQAEREELVKRVFPQVRRLCEERGVGWSEVDLRWGVTDEQKAAWRALARFVHDLGFLCLFMDSPDLAMAPQRGRLKMADIAQMAGVSISTVSRALAGNPLIPKALRDQIVELAQTHGYVVNQSARSLRLRKTDTIGVIIPLAHETGQLISDPFFLEMVGRLADEITRRNYAVLLHKVVVTETGWLERIIQAHRADGWKLLVQNSSPITSLKFGGPDG